MARPTPLTRADFTCFQTLTTRWNDNDVYGHMNNAVHYELFDTAVNANLLRHQALDFRGGAGVFLVVSTGCDYFAEIAFPAPVQAGLRVTRLGDSSVRYQIALFSGENSDAAAQGHLVHVYVDRHSRQPQPIPQAVRAVLQPVVTPTP